MLKTLGCDKGNYSRNNEDRVKQFNNIYIERVYFIVLLFAIEWLSYIRAIYFGKHTDLNIRLSDFYTL